MTDSGYFQINDIVLNIPPEDIHVDKQSIVLKTQTLRTRSSMKTNAGFSFINITIPVSFTSTLVKNEYGEVVNGFKQLADLISQFRVTPFCYVENQHLRNVILAGSTEPAMALAMRHIQIIKDNNSTNTINVIFRFSWFNYFPFLKTWEYKQDLFGSMSVKDPRKSFPWKIMYLAEQQKNYYGSPGGLDGNLVFRFNQFALCSVKKYDQLKREVDTLKQIKKDIDNALLTNTELSVNTIEQTIRKELGNEADLKIEDLFGHITSQTPSKPELQNAANVIQKAVDPNIVTKYQLIVAFTPVKTPEGLIRYKASMEASNIKSKQPEISDTILLERTLEVDFKQSGFIVVGIGISFENILAELPLVGQPYPTYQHIGSIDAEVNLTLMTTSEKSTQVLSNLYSVMEDQSLKFRMVPQGHRNVSITNDLINLCGLKNFIPTGMTVDTVRGQPGTFKAQLTLVDNSITAETQEEIQSVNTFSSSEDIRNAISEIIVKNLQIPPIVFEGGIIDPNRVRLTEYHGFYRYSPVGDNTHKDYDQLFLSICQIYGRKLGLLWKELVELFQKEDSSDIAMEEFYSLTNQDSLAIEKLQEDLAIIFEKKLRLTTPPSYKPMAGRSSAKVRKIDSQKTEDLFRETSPGSKIETLRKMAKERVESRSPEIREQELAEERKNQMIFGFTVQTYLRDFVFNKYLEEWNEWASRFLDRIILEGYLELRQFAKIRDALYAMNRSKSTCYPDFPLNQVVNLIESKGDNITKQLIQELRSEQQSSKSILPDFDLGILIQPDFYLYNRLTDDVYDIIPTEVQQKAVEVILENQQNLKIKAEKSWIQEQYEKHVIDETLVDQIKRESRDSIFDSGFWKNRGSDVSDTVLQAIASAQYSDDVFHFNDLVNDTSGRGLCCTMLEEHNTRGDLTVPEISKPALSFWAKVRDTIMPGTIVHRERLKDDCILKPNTDHHGVIQHFFGPSSIAMKHQGAYQPLLTVDDPNKDPIWGLPLPEDFVISSLFGLRKPPTEGASSDHKGIDFARPSSKGITKGVEVKAIADGVVCVAPEQNWQQGGNTGGNFIYINHSNGYSSGYLHLDWSGATIATSNRFWRSVPGGGKQPFRVNRGDVIGVVGDTGVGSGAHLHFEIIKNGIKVDPLQVPGLGTILSKYPLATKLQGIVAGLDPENESLFTKSVEQLQKDLLTGQGYSLMRAYPTFKLYFIESDMGERRRFGFDDFFQYSSVESIRLIKSRKVAADLVIINLTNISGVLSNRRFRNTVIERPDGIHTVTADLDEAPINEGSISVEDPHNLRKTNTSLENPIQSLMLREGVQIQLRLGYSVDPNELETVFNGVIVDVQPTEADEMITIVCQSFAIELVQNIHGEDKTFGGFLSSSGRTGYILEQLMAFPEVVHFGKWEGGKATNTAREVLKNSWRFVPTPYDDNIFAPTGRGIFGIFDSTEKYSLYQNTIWDVFQEMTLRHPSYIASAVPYQEKWGGRMTMFFGVPDQLYFSRDPTFKEDSELLRLKQVVSESAKNLKNNKSALDSAIDPNKDPKNEGERIKQEVTSTENETLKSSRKFWLDKQIKRFALNHGYIKPFRNYHVLTSTQHILLNNIESSSNVFNTATVQYKEKPESADPNGGIKEGNLETFTLRCDAAVQDEEVTELFAQYSNCFGYEMAKRYAVGLLFYSLKECYRGSIVVIGNPRIKPYDVCLKENTPILTNKGYKFIQDISTGDYVYSHRGVIRKVSQIFKHKPNDRILSVKCKTDPEILIGTANHPVLSVKRKEIFDDNKPWIGKNKEFTPIYRPLGELQRNDYIACPRIKSKRYLNPSLAQLIGYYLAEGSIIWEWRKSFNKGRKNNTKGNNLSPIKSCRVPVGIQWAFNSETEYFMVSKINQLLKEAGYSKEAKGYIIKDKYGHKRKKGLSIVFYDRDFTRFILQEVGFSDSSGKQKYLENKWLRSYFDEETTKYILGAYFNGDGSCNFNIRKGSLTASTTSINLGRCIRQLLLNIGIPVTSNIKYYENGCGFSTKPCCVYTNVVSRSYAYELIPYTWYKVDNPPINKPSNTTVVDGLYVYVSISEIKEEEKLDYVYNLGVEIDNSYIASGKVVHNCFIFDEYSDTFGPIEVEQVTHEFSQKRGFVTEIVPDMVVHVNQESTMSTSDAMGLAAEAALRKMQIQSLPSLLTASNYSVKSGAIAAGSAVLQATGVVFEAMTAGIGAAATMIDFAFSPIANMFFNSTEHTVSTNGTSAFGLLGTFIFKKVVTRTQLAHPFRYSPLVKHGNALVGALPNKRTGGNFIQGIKTFAREGHEGIGLMLADMYHKMDPNNWFRKSQGSAWESFMGREYK